MRIARTGDARMAAASSAASGTAAPTPPPPQQASASSSSRKRSAPDELDDIAREADDARHLGAIYQGFQHQEDCLFSLVKAGHDRVIETVVAQAYEDGDERVVCEDPDPLSEEWCQDVYWDDLTGRQLDPKRIEAARKAEIDYITSMGVWEVIPRSSVAQTVKVIPGRWVDVNKGDARTPNYRSRYVAKEIKRGARSSLVGEFFAAMAPLHASKILLILAVTNRFPDSMGNLIRSEEPLVVSFIDIKRAHFYGKATRQICVELPPELRKPDKDEVGLLLRSMYGTRDAAANWSLEIARVLVGVLQFTQGKSNPCLFYHRVRRIRTTVHGDDFESLGPLSSVRWFAAELKKHWMLEEKGILGPPGLAGTVQEMRHLNRILTWDSSGIVWEPDPRHVEVIIKELQVQRAVTTPLVKEKIDEVDEEEIPLDSEWKSAYQSYTMRLGYLSHDRTDLQRVVRELAKGMAEPTERHWEMLTRAARYLVHAPRVVQRFRYQASFDRLDVHTDTDHAGCIRTRKSTTGVVALLGLCQVLSLCRGQAVIALSSGEAEFYGLVTGSSEALGLQSLLMDWGIRVSIKVWMDATAGAAIGNRQGLGRVKHIDTAFLWVQDVIQRRGLKTDKVHTSQNMADMLTKAIDWTTLKRHMEGQGFEFRQGRSALGYEY